MSILLVYLFMSILVGIIDLFRISAQVRELSQYPAGDVGYYVFPKKILGMHNWVFLPSWLVINGWLLLVSRW